MNKLLEFTGPAGTVVIESSESISGQLVRGRGLGELTERVGISLNDTLLVIRPIADATLAACQELVSMPDSVEVEFGLNFNGSIGAFIVQGKAEACLNIKLAWKPE